MNFLERIKYLGELSFEKQFVIAVMSVERSYREIAEVFPKGIRKKPIFRESIDLLWKYIRDKDSVDADSVQKADQEIFKYVDDESNYIPGESAITYNTILISLARGINLCLAMITDGLGEKSGRISGNSVQSNIHIFDIIYENPKDNERAYKSETEWSTKAIYVIAASEEIPTNYEWFLERNPDYERERIYKTFVDIE